MRILTPFTLFVLAIACGPTNKERPGNQGQQRPPKEQTESKYPKAPLSIERDGLHRLEVGRDSTGEMRSVIFTVPPGYDPKGTKRYPAVWAFHGGKGNTAKQMYPNWEEHFDEDVVFVFPNGQLSDKAEGAWRVDEGTDMRHVDIVRQAYELIGREVRLDPKKQYATGFSSGSHMTWQLACQANDMFAGFAGVAHYLKVTYQATCKPPKNAPILVVGGRTDTAATWEGQIAPDGTKHTIGAEATAAYFLGAVGCEDTKPKKDAIKGAKDIERIAYPSCNAAKVELVEHPGGHDWPGGPGGKNINLDLSTYILEFFELK